MENANWPEVSINLIYPTKTEWEGFFIDPLIVYFNFNLQRYRGGPQILCPRAEGSESWRASWAEFIDIGICGQEHSRHEAAINGRYLYVDTCYLSTSYQISMALVCFIAFYGTLFACLYVLSIIVFILKQMLLYVNIYLLFTASITSKVKIKRSLWSPCFMHLLIQLM